MAGQHAVLAPSAAFRWVKCALSVSLEASYPEVEESPESLEGTAAHWVNEQTILGTLPQVDQVAPNGVAVTKEMLEGAQLVCESIERKLGPDWRSRLFVEQRVQIPRVHASQCWGTPDYYAWAQLDASRLILFVFDYKFGHELVEVFENWQLMTYMAGLLDQVQFSDLQIVVDFTIIQPRAMHRAGPVRSWQVGAADLRAHINILHMQGEKALAPNPEAVPDVGACKNCRGRHACEALQREAYTSAASGQKMGALDLSPHAVGIELRELKRAQGLLNARVSGLEAQAEALIKRGDPVPFWQLEAGVTRLKWIKPDGEVFMLGDMFGVQLRAEPEPITPTQAIKAGIPEDTIKQYAIRPPGSVKLTYDDGTKARMTFGSSNT